MNILGIETSCDETAAAVVKDGHEVLSNVVYTQIPLHQPYGGVVPEIASRAHVEKIRQVVGDAMRNAFASESAQDGAAERKIDAVAVTYGPGLSPALIVGLNAAKGLAKALGVPLIGINHIEAHLHTPFLRDRGEMESQISDFKSQRVGAPSTCTPALGLAISGGNTLLVDMPEYGKYEVIGETLDDAAGEAFDKAAKLLGLGYPGGLKIDRISKAYIESIKVGLGSDRVGLESDSVGLGSDRVGLESDDIGLVKNGAKRRDQTLNDLIPFPKGRPRDGVTALAGLPAELCVSFSGLKTALLRYVQQHPELLADKSGERDFGGYMVTPAVARVVASYQEAIASAVADRVATALKRGPSARSAAASGGYKAFILGGGVSLNSRIRARLTEVCEKAGVPLLMAKPKYTGDNGAMIAGLAYYRRNHVEDAFELDVNPSLQVGE